MKTDMQIAKNRTAKYSKAKVHARAQKPKSEWVRGLQTAQKTTPHCSRKELGESWPRKEREKVALRREKGALLT